MCARVASVAGTYIVCYMYVLRAVAETVVFKVSREHYPRPEHTRY